MGILKMVTAKVGDLSLWDGGVASGSGGSIEVSGADYRTPDQTGLAGQSFRVVTTSTTASNAWAYGALSLTETKQALYMRICFKANTYVNNDIVVLNLYEGTTSHVLVSVNPSLGQVKVHRSTTSTTLATSANNVWFPYGWTCLELWTTIADSGGRAVVRINGNTTPVIDFTGDTRNAATGVFDNLRAGIVGNCSAIVETFFDDIMVRDDAWCGTGGIYLLTPDSSGDESDWTASSGADWECLDELPPTFNDFVYTAAANAGDRSLFGVRNLPVTPTEVTGVGVFARVRVNAPGSAVAKAVAKSGSTVVTGAGANLDVGEVWATHFMEQDPDGSVAWTGAKVNSLQIGVENV